MAWNPKDDDAAAGQGKPPAADSDSNSEDANVRRDPRVRVSQPGTAPSGFLLARVFGIPIYIHPSWLIIFLLITFTAGGQFAVQHPNLSAPQNWALSIITSILFFASVIFHELSHSVVAKHYKISVESITLFVFGGLARRNSPSPSPVRFPACFWRVASGSSRAPCPTTRWFTRPALGCGKLIFRSRYSTWFQASRSTAGASCAASPGASPETSTKLPRLLRRRDAFSPT